MDYKLMGTKIRMYRQRQGLTQAQLAGRVAVSTSFIGHIERGSRKASIETLESICRVLKISMDSVAMPPRAELIAAGYSAEQIGEARILLEAALDMCK
ncbi:MAG: helix-turn-helix transcriptional regulator [Eubacteriales bacterium]|nr:helix-turn-helix transcriptional regulator [Eubacteriales bacterium]MDD3880681.1 helix-turn-helix transcriptional regulator [Eubacteriales bacterium]MDD4511685.1 helix-turn-helix transcriptional regulator [Eubacteriales bacterium]